MKRYVASFGAFLFVVVSSADEISQTRGNPAVVSGGAKYGGVRNTAPEKTFNHLLDSVPKSAHGGVRATTDPISRIRDLIISIHRDNIRDAYQPERRVGIIKSPLDAGLSTMQQAQSDEATHGSSRDMREKRIALLKSSLEALLKEVKASEGSGDKANPTKELAEAYLRLIADLEKNESLERMNEQLLERLLAPFVFKDPALADKAGLQQIASELSADSGKATRTDGSAALKRRELLDGLLGRLGSAELDLLKDGAMQRLRTLKELETLMEGKGPVPVERKQTTLMLKNLILYLDRKDGH